jgi:uncharacterized damage-inducible protein DinB
MPVPQAIRAAALAELILQRRRVSSPERPATGGSRTPQQVQGLIAAQRNDAYPAEPHPSAKGERMQLTRLFTEQLEREAAISRRALAEVPEGKADWKPHEKSMALGYLATLVAAVPSWVAKAIDQDELDIAPKSGGHRPPEWKTAAELVAILDGSVAEARRSLAATNDEHLATPWNLLVAGNVVNSNPRSVVIADNLCHAAHHRGQLTVYLRLLGAKVPSIYGPSADESRF